MQDEDGEDEEKQELDMDEMEGEETLMQNENPQLSLSALNGISTYHTMRVTGKFS